MSAGCCAESSLCDPKPNAPRPEPEQKRAVALWATIDLRDIIVGPCWKLKDSGEDFTWLSNEHCMLLVGYDETSYLFNDPWNNNGVIAYDRATVEDRYQKQHMQAVSVVRA